MERARAEEESVEQRLGAASGGPGGKDRRCCRSAGGVVRSIGPPNNHPEVSLRVASLLTDRVAARGAFIGDLDSATSACITDASGSGAAAGVIGLLDPVRLQLRAGLLVPVLGALPLLLRPVEILLTGFFASASESVAEGEGVAILAGANASCGVCLLAG